MEQWRDDYRNNNLTAIKDMVNERARRRRFNWRQIGDEMEREHARTQGQPTWLNDLSRWARPDKEDAVTLQQHWSGTEPYPNPRGGILTPRVRRHMDRQNRYFFNDQSRYQALRQLLSIDVGLAPQRLLANRQLVTGDNRRLYQWMSGQINMMQYFWRSFVQRRQLVWHRILRQWAYMPMDTAARQTRNQVRRIQLGANNQNLLVRLPREIVDRIMWYLRHHFFYGRLRDLMG